MWNLSGSGDAPRFRRPRRSSYQASRTGAAEGCRQRHSDVAAGLDLPATAREGRPTAGLSSKKKGAPPTRHQRYGNRTAAPAFSGGVGAASSSTGGPHRDAARATPSRAAVDLEAYPSLLPFRYEGCQWAWTCLAVGSVEEACRASEAQNDLVAYAASLTLLGDTRQALLILEAYVIGICVASYEALASKAGTTRHADLSRRNHRVVAEWLQTRTGPNTHLKDAEYRHVMRYVVALVEWRLVHRWYTLAMVLHHSEDSDAAPYEAPRNVWLRYFFALFPQGVPATAPTAFSRGGNIPVVLETLPMEETLALLLAQCEEAEALFISTVAAFYTKRFRSCLVCATRTLRLMGAAVPVGRSGTRERNVGLDLDAITMHIVRCRAALEVGERMQAAADTVVLLQQQLWSPPAFGKQPRSGGSCTAADKLSGLYVSTVGAALALYGAPLPEARTVVVSALRNTRLSPVARRYVLALAGHVHALTLLQVGELDAAAEVGMQVAPYASGTLAAECLYDVIVRSSVGLEDSTLALETPLSPHRLLYLALSPAFFGGLSRDGIRLRRQTDTFRLLYPSAISLYVSVRQLLPFHMNRAFYFFSQGNYREAWEDACGAVAAADEVVGSTEFAFTACFPLRVYFFACQVGLVLLEHLFQEEIDVVRTCLRAEAEAGREARRSPPPPSSSSISEARTADGVVDGVGTARSPSPDACEQQSTIADALVKEKERVFSENDRLALQVMTLCRQWTRQIQRYYPHSILGDVAQVQVAVMTRESDMLKQAVVLSRRYPTSTLAQNTLTLALYFSHNISEAVDIAEKNFQDFPHACNVMEVHRWLQKKNLVYVFNYRTLVPLRYQTGTGDRIFTKRMLIAIVLLAFNVAIVLLTCLLNLAAYIPIVESAKDTAVRLQLPSMVPLFFAAVFLVHAIVAASTPKNLIHTFLIDNHFCDSALSRFLFALRGVALVNVVNALQISLAGNNFLLDSAFYTFLMYLFLTCLFVPFTTRVWFLPSVDEPKVGVLSWLTLFCVDVVIAFVILLPHIVLAAIEPLSCLVYYFFLPSARPTEQSVSGSIRRRLLYHEQHRYAMPSRFRVGSGSRFIHVRFLSFLYWQSHSSRGTAFLETSQMEAEGYRAFPLVSPESVGMPIESLLFGHAPDDLERDDGLSVRRASGDTDSAGACSPPDPAQSSGQQPCPPDAHPRLPLQELLLDEVGDDVLEALLHAEKGGWSPQDPPPEDAATSHHGNSAKGGADGDGCQAEGGGGRRHSQTTRAEDGESDAGDTGGRDDDEDGASTDGEAPRSPIHALTRTSSRLSVREKEQFQRTTTDNDRLVDLVVKTLEGAGDGPAHLPNHPLKRANASFAILRVADDAECDVPSALHAAHGELAGGNSNRPAEGRNRRSLLPDPILGVARRANKESPRASGQSGGMGCPSPQSPAPFRAVSHSRDSEEEQCSRSQSEQQQQHHHHYHYSGQRQQAGQPREARNSMFTLEDVTEVESVGGSSSSSSSGGEMEDDIVAQYDDDNWQEVASELDDSTTSGDTCVPPILPHHLISSPRTGGYHARQAPSPSAQRLSLEHGRRAGQPPASHRNSMQNELARLPAARRERGHSGGGAAESLFFSALIGERALSPRVSVAEQSPAISSLSPSLSPPTRDLRWRPTRTGDAGEHGQPRSRPAATPPPPPRLPTTGMSDPSGTGQQQRTLYQGGQQGALAPPLRAANADDNDGDEELTSHYHVPNLGPHHSSSSSSVFGDWGTDEQPGHGDASPQPTMQAADAEADVSFHRGESDAFTSPPPPSLGDANERTLPPGSAMGNASSHSPLDYDIDDVINF